MFAASCKVVTLAVALMGGGLNPVTLLLKNLIFTTLLVVLLYKVRKSGALTLFALVTGIISLLFLGSGISSLPAALLAALAAEAAVFLTGGMRRPWAPVLCAAVYDFVSKGLALGISYLFVRETPELLYLVAGIVGVGYLGSLLGLYAGFRSVRELRHAGIIRI